MNKKLFLTFCVFFGMAASPMSFADEKEDSQVNSDNAQIEYLLKEQFDRPDSQLIVAPIIVDGDHAVAGWAQDGKGGRAYLSKTKSGWAVRMCSGESLTKEDTYTALGVSTFQASELTSRLLKEEIKMGNNSSKLFSSFEGTIVLDGSQSHHGTGEGHADAAKQRGHSVDTKKNSHHH